MAINLLGGLNINTPVAQKPKTNGLSGLSIGGNTTSLASGFNPNGTQPNLSSMSQLTVPMGQRAVNPAAATSGPSMTLPKAQAAPLASATQNPVNQVNPTTGQTNQQVIDASTAAANQARSVLAVSGPQTGTQHPGDAGFNPITPQQQQTATAQYDNNGNYIGTQMPNSAAPQTPQGTSFNGLLGASVNQQNSPYNQAAMNNINQTAEYGAGNIGIGQQAQTIGNTYGAQIEKVSNYGNALAGSYTDGAGLAPVSQGLAGQAQNTTANEVQGLQAAENAQLNPLGYQLTAQNQAANASNAAAGQSLTGQSQTYGALQNAYAAAKPQLGSIGQVPFSPTDQSQGAVLGSTQQGGLNAAGNLLGQFNGAQAVGAAAGNAQASNINTAGTAETNALASVYGQNAPAAYSLNTALNNIQSLGGLTLQTAQGGSINPLSTQVGNQTIARFKSGLGSASQASFNSNMAAFSSSLSALYADQSGATPTQVGVWQKEIADGSMPMQQLQAVYNAAVTEGGLRLNNLKNTSGSAYSGLQGSTGGSTGNTGGAGGTITTKNGLTIDPSL